MPILIAVRNKFWPILDHGTKELLEINYLFDPKIDLDNKWKKEILNFFNISWLRWVFENKDISNLHDYVFWVEVWLDTNARKNRTGKLMEDLVEDFIRNFCNNKWFEYKEQATSKWMKDNWYIDVKSDKSDRRFDFTIFTWFKVYVLETNYYNWWWSKLKSVAGEFSNLYHFLWKQDVKLIWITDWNWWQTALRPLEEAYIAMEWNIYNIEMLRWDILNEIIK